MRSNVTIPQPAVPYVKVWMGGARVTFGDNKRRLISFKYDMAYNQPGEFQLQFIDTEWTTIEALLHQNWDNGIELQYGWLGSNNPKLWTENKITMTAQWFTPIVYDSYVDITIKGNTQARTSYEGAPLTKDTFHQSQWGFVIRETRVSDAVKEIFKQKGFKVDRVEKTAELAKVHIDPHSTLTTHPIFLMTNQSALQSFINDWRYKAIEPNYKGQDNTGLVEELNGMVKGNNNTARGGYRLCFIDSDPPEVILTRDGGVGEQPIWASYDYPTRHEGAREVLSFSYTADIMANTTDGLGSQRILGTDAKSKITYSVRNQNYRQEPGPTRESPFLLDPKTDDAGVTASKIRTVNGGNSRSPKELIQFGDASYWLKELQIRRSSLNLLGRADALLNHHIMMYVWSNRIVENNKVIVEPHYSSGRWQVEEVHHLITPGVFTTALELRRLEGLNEEFKNKPEVGLKTDAYNKKTISLKRNSYSEKPGKPEDYKKLFDSQESI
jgi:hypothetical protein